LDKAVGEEGEFLGVGMEGGGNKEAKGYSSAECAQGEVEAPKIDIIGSALATSEIDEVLGIEQEGEAGGEEGELPSDITHEAHLDGDYDDNG
jgi:hypothetical protein